MTARPDSAGSTLIRGQLGAGEREPAFGFGPEVAEISNKRSLA
jgi:hypothetical protein